MIQGEKGGRLVKLVCGNGAEEALGGAGVGPQPLTAQQTGVDGKKAGSCSRFLSRGGR